MTNAEPVIVDTSCLIGLERIGQLHLLPALFHPVFAPPAVVAEFGAAPDWLVGKMPTHTLLWAQLQESIDPGEAEAIALAREEQCIIILDDLEAREVAQGLQLRVIGLVGVLVKAKQNGLLPALKPLLDQLTARQFRISQAVISKALRLADEE